MCGASQQSHMEVTVYGPLRATTGTKTVTVDADPETVEDALTAFLEAYPGAASHLLDCDDALRPSVRVLVDGDTAGLDDDCPADAEVQVFPAMRGG